ncbi:aldehyde reductase [Caulobacter segnis]|uniref:NAD-dependent epimerase/dehydratase n=2 Tax=Caulobacter segnis TaxID=88688 RepID=D5VK66_CAUST|nr:aldehyde reductase [Caulobacter segnis]ADG10889.1 NAD-dependent epimerase/dehydratase [Caulobacter segnis ATCC 21756]AVQ02587.1 aldehyde reductase [Caulobacter segnis]
MIPKRVLVTGGSGFIAGHCILQLLEQGHFVRSTIRSLAKEGGVRGVLEGAGMVHADRLSFVAADLLRDDGWAEAVAGMDVVLHVASPVLPGRVASEDAVIVPAREGTLRVLRAAREAGVKRVVLTSAFHAVSWGHPHDGHVFTEADWTILDGPGVDAYGKSKTLAERAAWDFIAAEGGGLELTTMLPVAVMGPVMGKDVSGANHIVQRMLDGAMPVVPNLFIPVVDVRDVASAHIMAMTNPAAAGERFLLSNGRALSLKEIGATIRAALGDAARQVPTRALPDFVVRIAARFNAEMRPFLHDLGYAKKTSNDKARRVLGWTPREPREAIVAAATSLFGRTG